MLKDLEKGNWIIPPWDSRYGKLGHIWKKYKNLEIKAGRNATKYFVPPELLNSMYISSKVYVTCDYQDPNLYNGSLLNFVNCRFLQTLLDTTSGLSVEEYYLLCFLKVNNRFDIPKCCYCGTNLKFINMSNGYGHHPETRDSYLHFCSIYCQVSYHNEMNIGFNSIDSNIRKARTQFTNRCESDIAYLYLVDLGDSIKFGISQYPISKHTYRNINYVHSHILYKGDPKKVADIEAELKTIYNGSELIEHNKFHEFLTNLKSILTRLT